MSLSFSYVDKGKSIFSSLNWSSMPKSTISTFLTAGETFSSMGSELGLEESPPKSCCVISSSI